MSEVKQGRAKQDFYFTFSPNSEISDTCLLSMRMRVKFQIFFTDCVDEREVQK